MALANQPKLLIADEPGTALDVTVQAQTLKLMADLVARHGTAVLFISHNLGVVREVADRVYVIYRGSIVESGRTTEIFEAPQHPTPRPCFPPCRASPAAAFPRSRTIRRPSLPRSLPMRRRHERPDPRPRSCLEDVQRQRRNSERPERRIAIGRGRRMPSPSSANPARARRPSPTSCSASTPPRRATSGSTAYPSPRNAS